MSFQFGSDHQVLSLIKNQNNEETKSIIEKEYLHDAVDKSSNTLLHYAAKYGNPEIVQFLIDTGSEVDVENDFGQTPLVRSLETDTPCKRVVEILLSVCNVGDIEDSPNASVLDIVNDMKWLTKDTSRYEILKLFLERAGNIFFFQALNEGNKDVIKLLLETNISLSKTDYDGRIFVHALVVNSNPGVVELLRDINFDVDIRDNDGWTPLMYAAINGNSRAVEFLLSVGADIEARENDKRTALYLANNALLSNSGKKDKLKRTVQVLLEYGANAQIETADDDKYKTIFDLFSKYKDLQLLELAEISLAHLALQELLGTAITNLIRSKINADRQLKNYFEYYQQKLLMKICPSITLLDVLTVSERKIERYLCNTEWASKFKDLQTKSDYFDTILHKRFVKASRMLKLRATAARIICKLGKLNYDSYPFVVDKIVSLLEEKDIDCLISIQN